MPEGFWIVKFQVAELSGSGVVVMTNGKLFGGETGFYYIGTYRLDGVILKARLMVHHFDRSVPSGFGVEGDYEMDVSATLRGNELNGTAVVSNQPKFNLGVRLTKVGDL